jgi:hypothetical protein
MFQGHLFPFNSEKMPPHNLTNPLLFWTDSKQRSSSSRNKRLMKAKVGTHTFRYATYQVPMIKP